MEGYRCRRRQHDGGKTHVAYGWQGTAEWTDEDAAAPRWQGVTYGEDRYGWSVDRLCEAARRHSPAPLDPAAWVEPEAVNRRWWRGVDLASPVILVPHPDGESRPILVDGRHRVYKAFRLGRQVLAVTLTSDEERAARFTSQEWERYREPEPW